MSSRGGQVFETEEAYVAHLAVRLFGTPDDEAVATLASRLREVRNPALLSDLSPQAAADALRESLPGVAEDVINATAEALAESDATREAFERDKEAAELLEEFRSVWSGHASEVVRSAHVAAVEAARDVRSCQTAVKARAAEAETARSQATEAKQHAEVIENGIAMARSEIEALEKRQSYKEAGRLNDLKTSAAAQRVAANAAAGAMQETARGAKQESDSLHSDLEHIVEDLEDHRSQALAADGQADSGAPLLAWTLTPRAPLHAGELVVDAGAKLVIHGSSAALREVASEWLQLAQAHAMRVDAAALALIDHKAVEVLDSLAGEKAKAARDAAARAEAESAKARSANLAAKEAARELLGAVQSWTMSSAPLAEPLFPSVSIDAEQAEYGSPWNIEDIDLLATAEPAQIASTCEAWARHALARAEGIMAGLRARAQQASAEAAVLREKAGILREQADELRSGRLLPLPRPEWAGLGDDSLALGTALEWQAAFTDPTQRALVEATMAAAGLLGASLGDDGANTRHWRVDPTGPVLAENLGALVAVDPAHPLASAASAVLTRVRIAPTASVETGADVASALCIGRDGTFHAGVLHGRVSGADDPAVLLAASHIGARQRRAAALVRAQSLDDQAGELEAQAAQHEQAVTRMKREVEAVLVLGGKFPSREGLRSAESHRAEMSRIAREARDASEAATIESERASRDLQRARAEWSDRTRNRGLPVDLGQLVQLRDAGAAIAEKLRKAAGPVSGKLADRLDQVVARYFPEETDGRLMRSAAEAQDAFRVAAETDVAVRVLMETAGAAIADVLARHHERTEQLSSLQKERGPAQQTQLQKATASAAAEANLVEARRKLQEEAEPAAAQRLTALRALLEVPGIIDAVLDGDVPLEDGKLLERVAAKLHGRKTFTMKTVLERADEARGKLSGIWALDPGDNHEQLLTFVLTYRDAAYTPIEAAAHAQKLKARAQEALAASDERALREFVIGRLPNAIGIAWTALQDWIVRVNRKMRSAEASSGVGVQVRVPLRGDLAPALRDVYELSCRVSGAERTPEQEKRLGAALHALLMAAEGETMQQKVASAVDIRDWVEVHYEVTRPGGKAQRWSSRTGLSGGERRLVVLAPMLAAIAAGYDRFGPRALRLVVLDEVPAEVDEQGREGLARYIAELDLDLICTSYLWDGCPGAWDGIEAYDLEAADDTVVAFPMLVRGRSPIPEPRAPELSQ